MIAILVWVILVLRDVAFARLPDIPPKVYAEEVTVAPVEQPVVVEEKKPAVDPLASNCYLYVKSKIPSLPPTADLKPNTTIHIGAVAIFNYGPNKPHFGIVSKIDATGFWIQDSNFGGVGFRTHFILFGDGALVGFWQR